MAEPIHAFDFLETTEFPDSHLIVALGDEPFLKRLVMLKLKHWGEDAGDDVAEYVGKTATWRDVSDELSTMSLFGSGPRLVVIQAADEFVSAHRPELEGFAASGCRSGRLILDVAKSMATNTNLYKAAANSGFIIDCKLPVASRGKSVDTGRIRKWIQAWAKLQHGLQLNVEATEAILDLVGMELGLIDQEIAKLALYADPKEKVSVDLIHRVIGGWRQKTTWEMLDAAASGNAAEALAQLDRLLQTGEHPIGLFGPISWSLRRFAAATRAVERQEKAGTRVNLSQAMLDGGFRRWPEDAFDAGQRQLRQLGRDRAGKMYQWLLETDLALKGSHSTPDKARFMLEQLIFRMAKRPTARARS
ncbi:MAG: DNA polymerase III subunit delta [Planctomycetales bacterium]|nr:DNA polymerase III subunit delta [Planctomycetales bacterium]